MKIHLVPKICLIFLLSIISISHDGKIALAEAVLHNSGKFMLVKTPDESKSKDYLLVEKRNGRKSLIEIEKQTGNRESAQKQRGTQQFNPITYYIIF